MEGYRYYKRKKWAFVFLAILFVIVVGFVIMLLWNWLMPALFGLTTINYWQALGLLVLSKILFGGIRKPPSKGGSWHWRKRFMKKWEEMSEEERDKYRDQFRAFCK